MSITTIRGAQIQNASIEDRHIKDGVNASKITITDTAGNFVSANVENALAETINKIKSSEADIKNYMNANIHTIVNQSTGNFSINNLTVGGDNLDINSKNVEIRDNIVSINHDETGTGVTNGQAGFSINRGSEQEYMIVFEESDDQLKIGFKDSLKSVATTDWVSNQTKKALIGVLNFAGYESFTEIKFNTPMMDTHYRVSITPIGNTMGKLGEVWTEKTVNGVKVYNSGSFKGEFDYIVLY